MEKKQNIKDWASDDRPREKLIEKGSEALSNVELIAILLNSGSSKLNAIELARQLLSDSQNDLNVLAKYTVRELTKISGIGEAKAARIIACMELCKRKQVYTSDTPPNFLNSYSVVQLMQPLLQDLPHEEFWALYLNRAHKLIAKKKLSIGGISATVLDIRLLFKYALECHASALIVCHNHPSGNEKPSFQDREITKKIHQTGKIMEIELLDHLIITAGNHYSFADSGSLA